MLNYWRLFSQLLFVSMVAKVIHMHAKMCTVNRITTKNFTMRCAFSLIRLRGSKPPFLRF